MKKLLFSIISVALLFPSCGPKCGDVNSPNSSYNIKVGERIEFQMKSCRDCAQDWQWKNSTNEHLKKISDDRITCDQGTFNMGSFIRTYVLEATEKGSDSIVLYLKGAGTNDTTAPAEKKIIYVTVN